ncbi:sugar transferase [Kocuria sp.]|uniref:sugar transferase n=1 Tax=Kocuria sp. TaxID=1871328 RepID=UPI0026DF48D5|nr:sugar transferase [Kocuria sp.]MDO5619709.1 sugar transferase [Kocuria sp.]
MSLAERTRSSHLIPAATGQRLLGVTWEQGIPRLLGLVDAVAIIIALTAAQIVRFGDSHAAVEGAGALNYTLLSAGLLGLWWLTLHFNGSRDIRSFGVGVEEYRKLAWGTLWVFGLLAIGSYVGAVETARGYVGLALPLGLVFLLCGRRVVRQIISRRRAKGSFLRRILIVGDQESAVHLSGVLKSAPHAGYLPVAATIPAAARGPQTASLPMIEHAHDLDSILDAVELHQVDAVAISHDARLSPHATRLLGWELQERRVSMIMAPSLTDVAGPRIHTQPVAGLPLIHVSTPKFEGSQAVAKRAFDLMMSATGLLVLLPLLVLTTVAIKLDSHGPVFFHQQRIGKDGKQFSMLKFRSMVVDAEDRKAALAADERGNPVLFKMRKDPRVTRVGAIIRRASIDELPQLVNVIKGEMSLMGPRPPLESEVATYEQHVHRRFMVQPGITGLWQVSGRSDLSWDESVRLDLYYVENWSMTQDLLILAKTLRAVVSSNGAY